MDLLLWRHAEAADGSPDVTRELTPKGRRDAREMARWLVDRGPPDLAVFASPAVRAQQTAAALGCSARVLPALAPGTNVARLLDTLPWPQDGGAWLLVGHQPMLGRLAALLLCGQEADWSFRKGALWWLRSRRRHGAWQPQLYALLDPALVIR